MGCNYSHNIFVMSDRAFMFDFRGNSFINEYAW